MYLIPINLRTWPVQNKKIASLRCTAIHNKSLFPINTHFTFGGRLKKMLFSYFLKFDVFCTSSSRFWEKVDQFFPLFDAITFPSNFRI